MMDTSEFTQKQFELSAEFGKYVFNHPELDASLPDGAYVYFEVDGEPGFNQFSREAAEKQRREEGVPVILVRIKGLAPRQESRLIDPVIDSVFSVAR